MRRFLLMMAAAVMMAGCQSIDLGQYEDEGAESAAVAKTKKFTFTVKADLSVLPMNDVVAVNLDQLGIGIPMSKAGYLSEDTQLTDLWVLDYMDGELVQQLHQSPTDSDWGAPVMSLAYGSHHVYFIASRGLSPALDTEAHTVSWATVRDTFWEDYEVTVVSTTNGNRAVTLDRVVSRLKVAITDEIPTECNTFTVAPATWYTTLNYLTGEPLSASASTSTITMPASYLGTTGLFSAALFSLSPSSDWTTDVELSAHNNSGTTLGQAVITSAPMKRNRSTEYSGQMFGAGGSVTVSLDDDWLEPYQGTW